MIEPGKIDVSFNSEYRMSDLEVITGLYTGDEFAEPSINVVAGNI